MSEQPSLPSSKYTLPKYGLKGFHCPHPECGVYSKQNWYMSSIFYMKEKFRGLTRGEDRYKFAFCDHCRDISVWYEGEIVYPLLSIAPIPHESMPSEIVKDYKEAREIFKSSPRASSALLRLSMEKLAEVLVKRAGKTPKSDLNANIGVLVKEGMPENIKMAMDTLRVIGNDAVHPGQIDFNDDPDIALKLFSLLNIVVENRITQVDEIEKLYEEKVPGTKKAQIDNRDK